MSDNKREIGIYKTCKICEALYVVEINSDDYIEWKTTEKDVYECFPYISDSEKILLLTDICPDCQITEKVS